MGAFSHTGCIRESILDQPAISTRGLIPELCLDALKAVILQQTSSAGLVFQGIGAIQIVIDRHRQQHGASRSELTELSHKGPRLGLLFSNWADSPDAQGHRKSTAFQDRTLMQLGEAVEERLT